MWVLVLELIQDVQERCSWLLPPCTYKRGHLQFIVYQVAVASSCLPLLETNLFGPQVVKQRANRPVVVPSRQDSLITRHGNIYPPSSITSHSPPASRHTRTPPLVFANTPLCLRVSGVRSNSALVFAMLPIGSLRTYVNSEARMWMTASIAGNRCHLSPDSQWYLSFASWVLHI